MRTSTPAQSADLRPAVGDRRRRVPARRPSTAELVYRQSCARCHEGGMARLTPAETTAGAFGRRDLRHVAVRPHAAAGAVAQRSRASRAVSEYLSGDVLSGPADRADPGERVLRDRRRCPADPFNAGPAWNGWGRGPLQHAPPEHRRGRHHGGRRAATAAEVGLRLPRGDRRRLAGRPSSAAGSSSAPAPGSSLQPRREERLHRLDIRGRGARSGRRIPVGPGPGRSGKPPTSATARPASTPSTSPPASSAGARRSTTISTPRSPARRRSTTAASTSASPPARRGRRSSRPTSAARSAGASLRSTPRPANRSGSATSSRRSRSRPAATRPARRPGAHPGPGSGRRPRSTASAASSTPPPAIPTPTRRHRTATR